jgi:hypothetical protein
LAPRQYTPAVFRYGTLNQKNGVLCLCGEAQRVLPLLQLTKMGTILERFHN